MSDELDRILDNATVIHLQPDDILVISNAEDIMQDPENFHRLSGVFGDRQMVAFSGPVDGLQYKEFECGRCGKRNRSPKSCDCRGAAQTASV